MATLPITPSESQYPPAPYPYHQPSAPRPQARSPRVPTSRRDAASAGQRLSKQRALQIVQDLKTATTVGAVVTFGALAVLVGGRLSAANTASASGAGSGASNGTFTGGDNQSGSNASNGGYFGQQTGSGSFGNFGGGGVSSGPVTGSSVS